MKGYIRGISFVSTRLLNYFTDKNLQQGVQQSEPRHKATTRVPYFALIHAKGNNCNQYVDLDSASNNR